MSVPSTWPALALHTPCILDPSEHVHVVPAIEHPEPSLPHALASCIVSGGGKAKGLPKPKKCTLEEEEKLANRALPLAESIQLYMTMCSAAVAEKTAEAGQQTHATLAQGEADGASSSFDSLLDLKASVTHQQVEEAIEWMQRNVWGNTNRRRYVTYLPKWFPWLLQKDMWYCMKEHNRWVLQFRDPIQKKQSGAYILKASSSTSDTAELELKAAGFDKWAQWYLGMPGYVVVQVLENDGILNGKEALTKIIKQDLWEAEEAKTAAGVAGEDECEALLKKQFPSQFLVQEELQALQKAVFGCAVHPTPDFLFPRPVSAVGTEFFWIDSKWSGVTPGLTLRSIVEKTESQFKKYVSAFGPGLVIWRNGFPESWMGKIGGVSHATSSIQS